MRVAFVTQAPLSLAFGGAEVQALRTAEALRGVGVEVEFLDPWRPTFDSDLLHCFTSEYQLAEIVLRARGRGIPTVTSAVFAPKHRALFYRAWGVVDGFLPLRTSFGMRCDVLNASDAVIALSYREARDLRTFFGVDTRAIHVVGNGADERFFTASPDEFVARYRLDQVVLHVGSLEPVKNQLRLIEALDDAGVPLVLIGRRQAREPVYADQVVRRLDRAPRAAWLGELPHDSTLLASAFAAAKVLALPSLTEAQPLAALQAAAAGANLVLSDLPYLRDTFGSDAWYCNPRSPASIRRAVLDAYATPRGARYTAKPNWLLTWTDVALRLRDIYAEVLARRGRR